MTGRNDMHDVDRLIVEYGLGERSAQALREYVEVFQGGVDDVEFNEQPDVEAHLKKEGNEG